MLTKVGYFGLGRGKQARVEDTSLDAVNMLATREHARIAML